MSPQALHTPSYPLSPDDAAPSSDGALLSAPSYDGSLAALRVAVSLDDLEAQLPAGKTEPRLRGASPLSAGGGGCPPRVLIYTTCYNVIDGVTLTIRKIEAEILAQGGHVCILTTRSGNADNTHLDGTHPHRSVVFLDDAVLIPFLKDDNNPECNYYIGLGLCARDRRALTEFGPTVCHITVPDSASLDVIKYARDHRLPLMGTYHSNIVDYMDHYGLYWIKPLLSAFFKHNYNFLQTLYVPTPFIKNKLITGDKLDRCTNIQIWGRGIDLEKFSPAHRSLSFREKLGIRPDEVIILFVGRLVVEKRPDIFANVIRRLYQHGYSFRALVVGAGPYEHDMAHLPHTTHLGWLAGHDLSVAYASSDIFLFPGALETFGNVTLEAAGSGLPLVVEEGCSDHLVRDGVSGYACPPDDEEAFYAATLELLTNDGRRAAMAARSRAHSLHYEKETINRQMVQNYATVTDEFHHTYAGDHRRRDAEFKNKDSFRAGTVERPLLLRLVEFFVIFLLFRVVWNLYLLYVTVLKYSSLAVQGAARVFSPLCCVRGKFSVSLSPRAAADGEVDTSYVATDAPPASSLRNTSQTPKEENTYIKHLVELLVTIILLFVRLQSVFITKLRYCSSYSRQQKDVRYIK